MVIWEEQDSTSKDLSQSLTPPLTKQIMSSLKSLFPPCRLAPGLSPGFAKLLWPLNVRISVSFLSSSALGSAGRSF